MTTKTPIDTSANSMKEQGECLLPLTITQGLVAIRPRASPILESSPDFSSVGFEFEWCESDSKLETRNSKLKLDSVFPRPNRLDSKLESRVSSRTRTRGIQNPSTRNSSQNSSPLRVDVHTVLTINLVVNLLQKASKPPSFRLNRPRMSPASDQTTNKKQILTKRKYFLANKNVQSSASQRGFIPR